MAAIGDHFAAASKANAITVRSTSDALSALAERHQIEVQTLRQMNAVTTAVGCLASASLAVVVVILALAYDRTRDEVSDMRVQHVRQVDGLEDRADALERERDAERQRAADADRRASDADTQAARDRARIDEVNAALAGLADWEPGHLAGRFPDSANE